MQKFVEATGKSIEDAVENAVAMLGVDRETTDVTIEIIDRPKAGFLGLGGTPAKVRASYDDGIAPPAPAKAAAPAKTAAPAKPRATAPTSAAAKAVTERATEFIEGLLSRMGIDAAVTATTAEDGTIEVNLEGENAGTLIGRRGETLTAIQHIAGYVANKETDERVRVTVDVENYRKKREETLCKLAHRTAGKVVRMRKSVTLEPMNAYERHVIHTALQEWRDVSTHSTGAEPRRAVVVSYTPGGGGAAKSEGDRPPRRDFREGGERHRREGGGERRDRSERNGGDRSDRRGDRRDRPPREPREPQEQKPAEPLKSWEWE